MGKNHRHKKNLKSEKGKVKLKVKGEKTKFLPKGQNVTDTTFKIKPIILPHQFEAKNAEEPLSKRKLNVKELLKRLKHYNTNIKVESAEELCAIISVYHEEILGRHLALLLQNASQLILDKEGKVRAASIKLINMILGKSSEQKVEPFFGILSSFLRCAMTNIDKNIQEDSLMFLDSLLTHVRPLVAKNSEKLFSNYLTLISTLRANSKPGRTLTVNLGSKLTSVKWRIKVLTRLKHILEAIIAYSHQPTISAKNTDYKYALDGNVFPVYDEKDYECPINFFASANLKTEEEANVSIFKQVGILMSLLYESWLEVAPEQKMTQRDKGTQLHRDSAVILQCILSIMSLLQTYVAQMEKDEENHELKNQFASRHYEQFISSLLLHFPYSQSSQQQKSDLEKILAVDNDQKCVQENLLICYMYCALASKRNRVVSSDAHKVTMYINSCLQQRNYVPHNKLQYLISVLKLTLLEASKAAKDKQELHTVLDSALFFYSNKQNPKNARLEVLYILCDIIDNNVLNKLPQYQAWLGTLAALLCEKQIPMKVIERIFMIAMTGVKPFHDALLKRITPILDNVVDVEIVEQGRELHPVDVDLCRTKILSLFQFAPVLYNEHIQALTDFMKRHKASVFHDFVDYSYMQT